MDKNTSYLENISSFVILEICAVSRHSKKEIGRCFKLILKSLGTQVDTVTTGDFMVSNYYPIMPGPVCDWLKCDPVWVITVKILL